MSYDLASVVDTPCLKQRDCQRGVNQIVEVHHLAITVKKGTGSTRGRLGSPCHLPEIIDAHALAKEPAQGAQIGHLPVAVEECTIACRRSGIACHLSRVV